MYIQNLNILNFRNIEKLDLSFEKKLNIIVGNNAQGKTNIVETIYISAFLKSFRTQNKENFIKINKNYSIIKSKIINNNVLNNVELYIDKDKKKLTINGKQNENFKILNVIIFHPEEVNYIKNYPYFRRNLIDRSIFYTDYNYLDLYKKYYRCLKQRNSTLKEKSVVNDYWIDQLIIYGSKIIRKRIEYIDKINNYFSSVNFKNICSEEYFIEYSKKYKLENIEENLEKDFYRKKEREKQLGYTLVGPHRDDILFKINGQPADAFASQGQKRSMIISFKSAQILDYKAVQGHYPVLILDDMTSELDLSRKNILLENLLESSGQVFITSTDFKQINSFEQSKVFMVNNGEVSVAD